MSGLIRVFPRRTSMTPIDEYTFVGDSPLWRPDADEVHVSVTFTWDVSEGERLAAAWSHYYRTVKLGGPAIAGSNEGFVSGRYVKSGVTFTSRGCPNVCPWCLVPRREGKLKLLDIEPGHVIQDNNFLATPRSHRLAVYEMLRSQSRAAIFSGGFESARVNDEVADELKSIRVGALFLAADSPGACDPLQVAVDRLKFLGLRSNKLRCYVMIGYNGESLQQAETRLETVWEIGCLPFAQLYQPEDQYIYYPSAWRQLSRKWSRPAAIRAAHTTGGGR